MRITSSAGRLKRRIWLRDHGHAEKVKCHWCPRMLTFAEATCDHEPPLSDGGTWNQAVIACKQCNLQRNRVHQRRKKAAP